MQVLLERLTNPATVLAFRAFRGEPSLESYLTDLSVNTKIFLPVISARPGEMHFFRWRPGEPLQVNRLGIEEPAQCYELYQGDESYQGDPAFALVPGLAFDKRGYRLGYGGGYYDRFLRQHAQSLVKIGFCYQHELLEEIPRESHDQRMNFIVTEKIVFEVPDEKDGKVT